jgi:TolB-like protein/Tfp pilus assembly protein PilF
MSSASSSGVKLEIGHVLFIDIVGYSKLLITEQREQLQTLKEIVRATEQFRIAEAEGKLLRLPTGDGGALVFRNSPEAPVLCALEISKELKKHPELRVRMGIHSGPVSEIADLNEQANIAGAGINIAQRVMDCGDAGHILLSKRVADDLEQYPQWRSHLHDLGECEVKHGVRIGVVNLSGDGVGNAAAPKKFQAIKKRRAHVRWAAVAVALLVLGAIGGGTFFFLRRPTTSALRVLDKSIAVLPFENLTSDKENAYFTDGVQDDILTKLAKIADLKVISRTSVMDYRGKRNVRQIGNDLRVSHVLEGSVRRSGTHLHLNAQLIDTRTDTHVWAEEYDRDLNELFGIQSEIAQKVAQRLNAKVTSAEKMAIEDKPTNDLVAFELYSRANDMLGDPLADFPQAIDLLNQAVARDPSFFEAYCTLVLAHDQLYFFGLDHTPARLAAAEAALKEAFRIRPNAGEAHLARAFHLYNGYLDYDGALAELEVARRSLPNDPRIFSVTGKIQRRQGRWEESIGNLERAIELDPRNLNSLDQAGDSYRMARRYPELKSKLDRMLTIAPDDIQIKVERAFVEVIWKADTRPLHQLIDEIRATNPTAMPKIGYRWLLCALAERDVAAAKDALLASGEFPLQHDAIHFTRPFVEGIIARMTNEEHNAQLAFAAARAEQEKTVQAQPDYGAAWCELGVIDAALGRKEEALREGRRAVELLPVKKDPINGMIMIAYLAMTAAWVGEKDLACEQLSTAVRSPFSGMELSYGELKLMPFWDPLRGDPCFEKIVASLAPKQ